MAGALESVEAPPLVLASSSPRRAQLLTMLGLAYTVIPADIDEAYEPGEAPVAHAERLAREKAAAVAAKRPDAIVAGSDTVVVIDNTLLGKPRDDEEAVRMLMMLQGREHLVATGVAVCCDGRIRSAVEPVRVRFRSFDEETARAYVRTGEPRDKAGAYGIQGFGAPLVERIDGDFFAVMGFPLARLMMLIEEFGWRYNFAGQLVR